MVDTLKRTIIKSVSGSAVKIIDGAGSNIIYTVLSISICNVSSSVDNTFSLWIDDVDNSGTNYYIYRLQSLPAQSTFLHNDKSKIIKRQKL